MARNYGGQPTLDGDNATEGAEMYQQKLISGAVGLLAIGALLTLPVHAQQSPPQTGAPQPAESAKGQSPATTAQPGAAGTGTATTSPNTASPGTAATGDTATPGTAMTGSQNTLAGMGRGLVGKNIYGSENTSIGEVEDVVIGANNQVELVLVDVGGFLGIGSKRVGIPVAQLQEQGERLTTSMTEAQVRALPEHASQSR